MKTNDFVQALGQVDEKYIEEALRYKSVSRSNMTVWRTIAIAACALLAASLAFGAIGMGTSRSSRVSDDGAPASSDFYYSAQEMEPQTTAAYSSALTEGKYSENAIYEDAYEMAAEEPAEYETAASMYGNNADTGAVPAAGDISEVLAEKKIIYNVYMDMQTKEFDLASVSLESLAAELGGFCQDQNISNSASGYRSASYTFRIPAERLDEFLEKVGQISTVTYMSRNAQDVSESYYDTQSRLESARTKLARLQELMKEAADMDDLIAIESAITDVEWEIDSYGSALRYYDSNVSYSTVSLNLSEVYEVIVDEAPMSFGERIGNAFNQGFRSIGIFFRNLVIWLASSWIWLIIAIVIIVLAIVLIRKAVSKRKIRKHLTNHDDE